MAETDAVAMETPAAEVPATEAAAASASSVPKNKRLPKPDRAERDAAIEKLQSHIKELDERIVRRHIAPDAISCTCAASLLRATSGCRDCQDGGDQDEPVRIDCASACECLLLTGRDHARAPSARVAYTCARVDARIALAVRLPVQAKAREAREVFNAVR